MAVHSAGDLQLGYAMAQYGGSTRSVKSPGTGSGGVCNNAGGTQTGWNIKWVDVASGAAGGSELANMGDWTTSSPLVTDLKTSNARSMYDHNQTRSKTLYMFGGASGTWYAGTLPGQDDEAVSYHSTLGIATTASVCNWSDYFCDDYARVNSSKTGWIEWYHSGYALWSNRKTQLIDQSESYNHYTNGAWGGIVSPVRSDMVANAL